jgi:MFS family permease
MIFANTPFEFLPWLVALALDAWLGHKKFLALVYQVLGTAPWSFIVMLLVLFAILAIRHGRRNPHRLAIVLIAAAFFLAGVVILNTEEFVWSVLSPNPSWRNARINAPTEAEQVHVFLMLLLGTGLMLSGLIGVGSQRGLCSWIASWSHLVEKKSDRRNTS